LRLPADRQTSAASGSSRRIAQPRIVLLKTGDFDPFDREEVPGALRATDHLLHEPSSRANWWTRRSRGGFHSKSRSNPDEKEFHVSNCTARVRLRVSLRRGQYLLPTTAASGRCALPSRDLLNQIRNYTYNDLPAEMRGDILTASSKTISRS
jgi:hypothetical protein